MAYVSKELKARLVEKLKPIAKKYGVKMTYAVFDHSAFVVTVRSGSLFSESDGEYIQHLDRDEYKDGSLEQLFIDEVGEVVAAENYDNSDYYTDYHDVGFYFYFRLGEWEKPYKVG